MRPHFLQFFAVAKAKFSFSHKSFVSAKFFTFFRGDSSPEAPVTTATFPCHFSIFSWTVSFWIDTVDHLTSRWRMTITEEIATDFQYLKWNTEWTFSFISTLDVMVNFAKFSFSPFSWELKNRFLFLCEGKERICRKMAWVCVKLNPENSNPTPEITISRWNWRSGVFRWEKRTKYQKDVLVRYVKKNYCR